MNNCSYVSRMKSKWGIPRKGIGYEEDIKDRGRLRKLCK